jgi:DNA-binding MarR family transcriptional regulator
MNSTLVERQAVRRLIRELNGELAALNRHVGLRVELRDVDLACLDLLAREGPKSPKDLSRLTQLHPATLTGVLDRLEQGGWIERRRASGDRRSVIVHALGNRARELTANYAGMNSAIDEICAAYDQHELAIIAGFLERVAAAGKTVNAAFVNT